MRGVIFRTEFSTHTFDTCEASLILMEVEVKSLWRQSSSVHLGSIFNIDGVWRWRLYCSRFQFQLYGETNFNLYSRFYMVQDNCFNTRCYTLLPLTFLRWSDLRSRSQLICDKYLLSLMESIYFKNFQKRIRDLQDINKKKSFKFSQIGEYYTVTCLSALLATSRVIRLYSCPVLGRSASLCKISRQNLQIYKEYSDTVNYPSGSSPLFRSFRFPRKLEVRTTLAEQWSCQGQMKW